MNRNFWDMYKETPAGKELIELFSFSGENVYDDIFRIYEKLDIFNDVPDFDLYASWFQHLAINLLESNLLNKDRLSFDDYKKLITEFQIVELELRDDEVFTIVKDPTPNQIYIKRDKFRRKLGCIQYLSMFLYCQDRETFKPILFPQRFNLIEEYAELLDMDIPEVPRSNKYEDYLIYYYNLCEAFSKFQKAYNLTDEQFCACLYGYAPLLKEDAAQKCDLPKPTNVWMTGASKEDYEEFLSNMREDSSSIWACNERTKRGDIVIIYARTPYSCIHSIWRADSGGRFQPFDYYHCRTTVRDGVVIPPISYNELKEHPYFKNLPIVRKNLQGVNGVELSASDYNELLKLIEEKGGDVSALPQLFIPRDWQEVEYEPGRPEANVEEKLLIPLLESLDYTSNDWNRQLSQKAGRKEKAIPDFVFFPTGEKHAENAPMVIEAKYDMSSSRERYKAYTQCRSYAKMMSATIMGICDKERFVLFTRNKKNSFDYSNPTFEAHWATIYGDPEVGTLLRKLICKEVILSISK